MATHRVLGLLFTVVFVIVTIGCATLMSLLPSAPSLLAAILQDLDENLETYQFAVVDDDAPPELALALQAIQAARQRLIRSLLDCLASEYPEIDLTPYLERFNHTTVLEPLRE